MYYIYILKCLDGTLYTGSTNDIDKRFKVHLAGHGARYTKIHKPEKVVYREEFATRRVAMQREIQIKKWTKVKKEALICGDMEILGETPHLGV